MDDPVGGAVEDLGGRAADDLEDDLGGGAADDLEGGAAVFACSRGPGALWTDVDESRSVFTENGKTACVGLAAGLFRGARTFAGLLVGEAGGGRPSGDLVVV